MTSKPVTLAQWLRAAEAELATQSLWRIPGVDEQSPRREAQWLLAAVVGQSLAWLLTWPERELSREQQQQADAWLARRLLGEPLALLRGEQEFWSLSLHVTPDTLVPRADTERLVEVALSCLPSTGAAVHLLDLGTGSGAVALALARALPLAQITAVDRSLLALAVAQGNGERLGLPVRWLHSDWFSALAGEKFQIIVSNPPYLADDDPHLSHVRHEPLSALVAGEQGMADLLHLVREAPRYLLDTGWLLLEHGATQAEAVRAALFQCGFAQVQTWQDLSGLDRVSGGRWPRASGVIHAQ
ncbi:MAG: peptide chain release factor N(5)-glutamine methyltransferase [Pseudomonadota bacterium]